MQFALTLGASSKREPIQLQFPQCGHVFVTGGPATGKSHLLKLMIVDIKRTCRNALIYVCAVASPEEYMGLVENGMVDGTFYTPVEAEFGIQTLEDTAAIRQSRTFKRPTFLIIDDSDLLFMNFGTIRLQQAVSSILSLGENAGMYVVAAGREMPELTRKMFKTIIEFRHDRNIAAQSLKDGQAFIHTGHETPAMFETYVE